MVHLERHSGGRYCVVNPSNRAIAVIVLVVIHRPVDEVSYLRSMPRNAISINDPVDSIGSPRHIAAEIVLRVGDKR
jgi:hypothetical protein